MHMKVLCIDKDRSEMSSGMGDQGQSPLDLGVTVEEATDILPPLDRSWRIA